MLPIPSGSLVVVFSAVTEVVPVNLDQMIYSLCLYLYLTDEEIHPSLYGSASFQGHDQRQGNRRRCSFSCKKKFFESRLDQDALMDLDGLQDVIVSVKVPID